jgi:hypothetical protein
MNVTVDNQTRLFPLSALPGGVVSRLKARLIFANPAFLEAERRGYWTGDLDREICCYDLDADTLILPRGFTRQLSILFLCTPIRSFGRLLQAMGRVLRPRRGKKRQESLITWTLMSGSWKMQRGHDNKCMQDNLIFKG